MDEESSDEEDKINEEPFDDSGESSLAGSKIRGALWLTISLSGDGGGTGRLLHL